MPSKLRLIEALLLAIYLAPLYGAVRSSRHQQQHQHQQGEQQQQEHHGSSLPGFAYDFSEYVVSALIERASDSNELYLSMFLVGHDVVFNDYPFETISTSEETLFSWGQASKVWDRNKNRTALTRHSGLACLLKNNDPKHKQAYRVPALWVPTSEASDSRLHGSLEILRCRLKGTTTIYSTLSKMPQAALFADLIRVVPLRGPTADKQSPPQSQLQSQSQSHNSSSLLQQHAQHPYDVLLSFRVPWRSRMTGYGLASATSLNASCHDPWKGAQKHTFLARNKSSSSSSSSGSTGSSSNSAALGSGAQVSVHLCVAGLRPRHPMRPSVGLPMLLEFIEHHISLGVEHIFMGILLSPRSPHFSRHAHVLRGYIERGQVSLASLALEGYDDAGGFGGVHMQQEYTDMFFHNQCLYLSKGVADFVILLRPTEFLAPTGALHQHMIAKSPSSHLSFLSSSIGMVLKALPPPTSRAACYYKVAGAYGVPDPPESFGLFAGPADSVFSAAFFKTSRAIGALNASNWHAPVLPTRLVMATTSRDAVVCSPRLPGTKKAAGARGGGIGGAGIGNAVALVRAHSVALPPSSLLSFVLGANLKKADYISALQTRQEVALDFTAAAQLISVTAQARLASRGLHSVASLAALAANGVKLHDLRATEALTAAAFYSEDERKRTPLHHVPTAGSAQGLKAPFWLKCDVAALQQVLNRVFK